MSSLTNPTPQFGTAEFEGGPDRCQLCGQALSSTYYRVGPSQSCPACAEKAKFQMPTDTHSAFVRGIVFGLGGAVLGLIAYSTFTIVTGIEIGYLSLLVGFLVAKAILMGSRGIGGRRYQVTALVLTYAAVSLSAIPIAISFYVKQESARKQGLVQHPSAGQPSDTPGADSTEQAPLTSDGPTTKPTKGVGEIAGYLLMVGLASPFLGLREPVSGAIGIVILLVGIRIAWRMTAGTSTEILGPFNRTSVASAPPPAAPPPLG